ncbi:Rieske 2Fe-2S domain-containing protein [Streptomyces sp. NPDC101455]|uniref:aromatic ring-hydroxylating oxygenase subunit alpha n=1 Tax=Streptomyces sp. NPDC101455 TaxID=3366142 RepID=UPI00380C274E
MTAIQDQGGVDAFLAGVATDLDDGVLPIRAFSSPELHQLELERVFAKSWVYVGHVTEIPNAGDYVLRYVGRDQFILARDEDGEIHLLFNSCMHRATAVCHAEKGNSSHFRCPYHGWIYKNNGDWNGAPHRVNAYPRTMDPQQWGLRKAPHVDTYHGLIFVNLDPDAISLTEYLGDMAWYLDVTFGLNPHGMRVVGDPHRWVAGANWKSGAENFGGDAYHVPHLHRSGEEVGVFPNVDAALSGQFHIAVDGGHSIVASRGFLPEPWVLGAWPPDVAAIFELDKLTSDQQEFVNNGWCATVFTIFPNLSILHVPGVYDAQSTPPVMMTALRQWQPRSHDKTEIWNWPLEWIDAPAEFNRLSYDAMITSFGPAGLFEQDDTVAWQGPAEVGTSVFARQTMKLNYQLGQGVPGGFGLVEDWKFPGVATTSVYDEHNQLRFWKHWQEKVSEK